MFYTLHMVKSTLRSDNKNLHTTNNCEREIKLNQHTSFALKSLYFYKNFFCVT